MRAFPALLYDWWSAPLRHNYIPSNHALSYSESTEYWLHPKSCRNADNGVCVTESCGSLGGFIPGEGSMLSERFVPDKGFIPRQELIPSKDSSQWKDSFLVKDSKCPSHRHEQELEKRLNELSQMSSSIVISVTRVGDGDSPRCYDDLLHKWFLLAKKKTN
jgi:hypothetical protein